MPPKLSASCLLHSNRSSPRYRQPIHLDTFADSLKATLERKSFEICMQDCSSVTLSKMPESARGRSLKRFADFYSHGLLRDYQQSSKKRGPTAADLFQTRQTATPNNAVLRSRRSYSYMPQYRLDPEFGSDRDRARHSKRQQPNPDGRQPLTSVSSEQLKTTEFFCDSG